MRAVDQTGFDFDFLDIDTFARGTPHDALAQLRNNAPVFWHQMPAAKGTDGFWLVTKHRDICDISKNVKGFFSHNGSVLADAPRTTSEPWLMMVREGFAHLDPPKHTAYKHLIGPHFAARAVASFENRVRYHANRVLDSATALGKFDFVTEISVPFPVAVVFGEILGFDPGDFERAIHWGSLFNRVHVIPRRDWEFSALIKAAATALPEMYAYALNALRSRRDHPRDDMLSVLAHMKTPDGKPLSEEMFVSYFWSLAIGAFDTTAGTIAGGILALNSFPTQRERLNKERSLVTNAVEEMLRWETPVIYFRRTAAEDTRIRERTVKRGDRVVMCYAAANRDEEVFANSNTFDVSREPNPHLAFGHGPHFCLGSHIARLEIRILLEEIVRRELYFDVCGDIIRERSNFINRIVQMPVVAYSRKG